MTGSDVRALRESLRFTRRDVADAVHCDPSYLYKLESGRRPPRGDVYTAIVQWLQQQQEGAASGVADRAVAVEPVTECELGADDLVLIVESGRPCWKVVRDGPEGLRLWPITQRDGDLLRVTGRTTLVAHIRRP